MPFRPVINPESSRILQEHVEQEQQREQQEQRVAERVVGVSNGHGHGHGRDLVVGSKGVVTASNASCNLGQYFSRTAQERLYRNLRPRPTPRLVILVVLVVILLMVVVVIVLVIDRITTGVSVRVNVVEEE